METPPIPSRTSQTAPSAPSPAAAAAKIRVLFVDDSCDVTSILGQCIQREPDMESLGALRTADDLVAQVTGRRPDVMLLDMTMPGKDPLAALRELAQAKEGCRDVRVIVFSGYHEHEVADRAAQAGACGFLSKRAQVPEILDAIRGAARWRRGIDPFVVWP